MIAVVVTQNLCFSVAKIHLNSLKTNILGKRRKGAVCLASSGQNSSNNLERKRHSPNLKSMVSGLASLYQGKIVEHICLLKAKGDLSEKEEKDMLDYLYTSQYHMSGIVAISLGRTSDKNSENYTHAAYMRFQRKEDLSKFYKNPFYLRVLEEHVTSHCQDLLYLDFEAEVEDDILAIFRKGEEFNYGVEFMLLIKFYERALDGPAEDALTSVANLAAEFPSLIVQSTQGRNINPRNQEYSHGVLIRFRSAEAQQIFFDSSEYKQVWKSKLQPICEKTMSIQFLVDPVGTELM